MGLGSKSQKKKGKNSSSAPKSAMAAKEPTFNDNKRVLSKKTVLFPLIDSPRKDEPESESHEEEERIPPSDKEKRKNKTKKKKTLVEKNDGSESESESDEEEEGTPSSDEEKRKKKPLVEKNDGSDSESDEEEGNEVKEKGSKCGEEKGKETSSSEDENTVENQKKASDNALDESDASRRMIRRVHGGLHAAEFGVLMILSSDVSWRGFTAVDLDTFCLLY